MKPSLKTTLLAGYLIVARRVRAKRRITKTGNLLHNAGVYVFEMSPNKRRRHWKS